MMLVMIITTLKIYTKFSKKEFLGRHVFYKVLCQQPVTLPKTGFHHKCYPKNLKKSKLYRQHLQNTKFSRGALSDCF